MERFCWKCGAELIDGVCPRCVQSEAAQQDKHAGKFKNFFMSPNEKPVAVLGNSYVENFFQNGSMRNGFAVVSDKRVYFRGNSYYITYDAKGRRKVMRNQQSRTVDLKDITGSGTDSYADVRWKIGGIVYSVVVLLFFIFSILSILASITANTANTAATATTEINVNIIVLILVRILVLFVFLLPAILCFFMYKRSQVSLVTIQYAGGEIGFDKNWFTQQEIELFQKEIRLAKDKAIEASENAVADKLQEAVSNIAYPAPSSDSKADELSKLADLLQRGVITQEEFEKMKKELI